MIEKVREIADRFKSIEYKMTVPEYINDRAQYLLLVKEHNKLKPIADKYDEYLKCVAAINDAKELSRSDDEEICLMAREELAAESARLEKIEYDMKVLLLPKDENDDKNVILEIRAGAGGEEAALFVYDLYRMYSMYSAAVGWDFRLLDSNDTELGGFKEVSVSVSGSGVYSKLKFESGVHRVQRVPETESQGRIQTSTVTVAVLPETDDVEIQINPEDITVETCKSSGAGGQHINKTESAIRIIHKPTGIVVGCQTERSQLQNKETAMKMLRAKLYDIEKTKRDAEISSSRKSQFGTGYRSERIRTYNYPQGRITDHRIGLTLYSLDDFMNGNISQMIDALIAADTAEKLKNGIE
ncbi:MAG: peptide chain release factor 1 [Clostridia bacterium]|nr:peptide chain release factor 1 [Clostridia bacterium]